MYQETKQPESSGTQSVDEKRHAFCDLPLSAEVQQAVAQSGYECATAIQAKIIPSMLEGRDVLAQSQTGSGKTAAFALPILTKLEPSQTDRRPSVLVLTPTRELAIQVAKSFSVYASCMEHFNVAAIYGGQEYEPQLKQLRRGVDVVVGTPGRVIDHLNRGTLDLSGIDTLVLDEADEMLNMGFQEDVEFVLGHTPPGRQVALFSATLPEPIQKISQQYLSDPVRVRIKRKSVTAESIRQRALFMAPRHKVTMLKLVLEMEDTDGVIVFTKTKDSTLAVAEKLIREGLSASALNGDMPQKVRERTIDQLKEGKLNILVATDVAARGLDVSRVSHVINFDLPHDVESYIHRIGRTGRAGRKGEAIIFLTNSQRGKLRTIERVTKQTIDVIETPTIDEINAKRVERFKERITDVTAARDLTFFKDLIAEYQQESGKPIELIAAALAQISQRGRPFLMKELPQADRRERERGERRPGRESSDGQPRPKRRERFGAPEAGMQRFRIEVGRRDGVRPGNIVGAIANEAGLDGGMIGPIQIHESFSTVDLPEGMPDDIRQTLSVARVGGRELQIKPDRGRPTRKPYGAKPKKNKRGPHPTKRPTDATKPSHGGPKAKKKRHKAKPAGGGKSRKR
ncbi:MAG: DEAD/DEAH box helicase [Planctomycetota bacterium]